MTKEEYLQEKAVEIKHNGRNCTQAVTEALNEIVEADNDLLSNISSGFGLGMGNMENTCGALTGAVMMSGLKNQGKGTMKTAKQMSDRFVELSGARYCKDLKGRDTGKILCECDNCVRNAIKTFLEFNE